jgi:hypothetical protein
MCECRFDPGVAGEAGRMRVRVVKAGQKTRSHRRIGSLTRAATLIRRHMANVITINRPEVVAGEEGRGDLR